MEFKRLIQAPFKNKGAAIADQILGRIAGGNHRVGEKLPAERIIAEQMGVSRPSVREAISALQIGGILETRPGDGTYIICSPTRRNLAGRTLAVLEDSESPYDILQARRTVEIGVLKLAIEVGTDEDLRKIKTVWDEKRRRGKEGDFEAYTRYGKDFHLAIAEAARNPVIIKMMDSLLNVMQQPLWVSMRRAYYEEKPSRIERMMEIHTALLDAVLKRDVQTATEFLEADFNHVLSQLYSQNEC